MRHFATESGKSKGQFYTPAEVSRVIAQILGIRHADTSNDTTVYDPTCGSGSLLLKVGDEAAHGKDVQVTLYGQEKDASTAALARMNMILHGYATAEIRQGNTLAAPRFVVGTDQLKTFDYVVANPPFSDKRWTSGLDPAADAYGRFQPYGVPPAKQGDYAYLLHILRSLRPEGQGACILPHGVLFRGNAEAAIRRNLVQRGYIKGIIGLPANLFYGTGIPACIIVLDKAAAAARQGIFMIDAAKGFRKDGPKNRLREQDIHRMVDSFTRQAEQPGYARLVPLAEIADPRNDFNLNLPRYIDGSEPEDRQDLEGHLRGGIPARDVDALAAYWSVCPGLNATLFQPLRPGYRQLAMPAVQLRESIFGHGEFVAFKEGIGRRFAAWRDATAPRLKAFGQGGHPKGLIEDMAEALLAAFADVPLLDAYDIYQHLLDDWAASMQDDCYLIADDGWRAAAQPRLLLDDKGKKAKARPDLTVGKRKYQAELIPPELLIARYFGAEQDAIEAMEAAQATIQQQVAELVEEHSGAAAADGAGLLDDAKNDKDKLTRASVAARLKDIKGDSESADEAQVLRAYLALSDQEADTAAQLKAAQDALMERVLARYAALTEDELKTLVVDDKWLATLAAAVQAELDRVSQTLTGRIRQLADRYAAPLPQLVDEVAQLAARVEGHLRRMGVEG